MKARRLREEKGGRRSNAAGHQLAVEKGCCFIHMFVGREPGGTTGREEERKFSGSLRKPELPYDGRLMGKGKRPHGDLRREIGGGVDRHFEGTRKKRKEFQMTGFDPALDGRLRDEERDLPVPEFAKKEKKRRQLACAQEEKYGCERFLYPMDAKGLTQQRG